MTEKKIPETEPATENAAVTDQPLDDQALENTTGGALSYTSALRSSISYASFTQPTFNIVINCW